MDEADADETVEVSVPDLLSVPPMPKPVLVLPCEDVVAAGSADMRAKDDRADELAVDEGGVCPDPGGGNVVPDRMLAVSPLSCRSWSPLRSPLFSARAAIPRDSADSLDGSLEVLERDGGDIERPDEEEGDRVKPSVSPCCRCCCCCKSTSARDDQSSISASRASREFSASL